MATGAPMGSMGVLGRNTAAANLIIEDHIKKRVNRGTMVYKDPKKSTLVPRVNHSPFGDFPTDFLPAGAKPARASPAKPDASSLSVTATSKLSAFIFQKSRHPSKKAQAAAPRPAVSTLHVVDAPIGYEKIMYMYIQVHVCVVARIFHHACAISCCSSFLPTFFRWNEREWMMKE